MNYQDKPSSFSERLKEALNKTGTKQIELSRLTGIDKGTINNYLAGKYEPKQDKLSMIADALRVDPVWLMGYDVPMKKEKPADVNFELNEGESMLLDLFRRVPEDRQQMVLDMIRIALKSGQ